MRHLQGGEAFGARPASLLLSRRRSQSSSGLQPIGWTPSPLRLRSGQATSSHSPAPWAPSRKARWKGSSSARSEPDRPLPSPSSATRRDAIASRAHVSSQGHTPYA